jgi:2-iminobutanoate/2-iminopropanoate deaminase
MTRKVISTADAPKAIGPYSAGISTEKMIFASGSLGIDPDTGDFVPGGVEEQTRQATSRKSFWLGEVALRQ